MGLAGLFWSDCLGVLCDLFGFRDLVSEKGARERSQGNIIRINDEFHGNDWETFDGTNWSTQSFRVLVC